MGMNKNREDRDNSLQTDLSSKAIFVIEYSDTEVQLCKQLFQPVTIHLSTFPIFHSERSEEHTS